ncbi:Protease [Daphnia magna]|uniref:Protease n=1 Tax=Daphnia magna TaxID=35525 RepID=A0A164T8D3_9CRUS|nr:Protease [Daphnia magna]
MNYATTEKEALAVIFAIRTFRHFLQDEPFLVISDHKPLQWFENLKENTGRLGRWAIELAATK